MILDRLAARVAKPATVFFILVEILDPLVLEIAFGIVLAGLAHAVGDGANTRSRQHLHRHRRPRARKPGDDDHGLSIANSSIESFHTNRACYTIPPPPF